jgi:predicted phage replisome organizer
MADVKWIKITTDIFDDEKILLIESLPERDSLIVIWFKLLCMAGKQNNSGVFTLNDRIAYTDEMLSTIFRRPLNTVRLALNTFQQYGMVEIIDGVITIPNWSKHQSLDAYEKRKERDRLYQAERRAAQRALLEQKSSDTSSDIAPLEEDKDKDKEIDLDIDNKKKTDLQSVVDIYHKICISFPRVRSLSEARKKAIKARLNTYTLDEFRTVFENAEASSFLKGSNDRNWQANFDWLIADKNIAKVLEGNYADKPGRYGGGRKEKVPGWLGFQPGEAELESIRRTLNESPEAQAERDQLAKELQAFGRKAQ